MKALRALATFAPVVPLVLAPLFLAGCDENNAISIRLRVQEDMSGVVMTSALSQPSGSGAVESAAVGATFDREFALRGSKGKFAALDGLAVGDVKFSAGASETGLRWVRVELPTGADARWPGLFVPLTEPERRAAAEAFELSREARDVGKMFRIEIELPGAIVSNGAAGKVRGMKNESDGRLASLTVPIEASRAGTEPIVWQLTW